jgi:hypothetical protein
LVLVHGHCCVARVQIYCKGAHEMARLISRSRVRDYGTVTVTAVESEELPAASCA